jgi:transposase-like protein
MERKERRHFTREFKLEAVRLAAAGDKTKAKVARELGIRVNQLPPVARGLRARRTQRRSQARASHG